MNEPAAIEWDEEKNQRLLDERGIGFEDVVEAIESGRILADEAHPIHPGTVISAYWSWSSADTPVSFPTFEKASGGS